MPITLPDLSGRTAVVTGASDGVGVEIVRGLAGAGADVVLPVRNRAKGERAIARIRETQPDARLSLRDLDLARLDSVAALADALRSERAPVDLLVLNAGIVLLGDPERHVTDDGFELHFQTNFLGHFALTTALLPVLRERRARVVVQCSLAAAVSRVDWGDLASARRYRPLRAYGASKVALGLFACELARRSATEDWGVSVQLSHPGVAPDTAIAPALRARAGKGLQRAVAQHVGNTPAQAAEPALLASIAPAVAGAPDLFGPSGPLHFGGPAARQRPYRRISDPAAGARMWAVAEQLLAERVRPA
ncbi:SDR family oxidoreductase [Microbacterium kyungheense]|uniref:Short-subunit dehydrogenase n=1 Tax=Microbacterium kyungheense TaxID=1263636 RepID=A0A543EDQ9_9MICO|nr:SDR family oxidoreductase [Microbacterium kyungheense]TQM19693.1 short-subunit dehydrogenase [Microbacterium kyungheense]